MTLTSTGRVEVGLSLDPDVYQLLRDMSAGPRAVGALLDDLVRAEAARRADQLANAARTTPSAGAAEPVHSQEPASFVRFDRQLHEQRLTILSDIHRAIPTARSPASIAQAAAEGVIQVTDAARVVVSLWEPDGDTFEVLAWAGVPHPHLQAGMSMAFQPWPWLDQVRQGQIAFDDDLVQQPDPTPEGRIASEQGFGSHVAIPLMVGERPIGHLDITRLVAGRLLDGDLALARQVADSLALAMHDAQLLGAERQARQTIETLQAATAILGQSLDLDTVLDRLLDVLSDLIPYDSASVLLVTGEETLAVYAMQGYDRFTNPALTRRLTFDACTHHHLHALFESQQSLLLPDTDQIPSWQHVPGTEHVRCWLAVPLVVAGEVVGIYRWTRPRWVSFSRSMCGWPRRWRCTRRRPSRMPACTARSRAAGDSSRPSPGGWSSCRSRNGAP